MSSTRASAARRSTPTSTSLPVALGGGSNRYIRSFLVLRGVYNLLLKARLIVRRDLVLGLRQGGVVRQHHARIRRAQEHPDEHLAGPRAPLESEAGARRALEL